MMAMTERFEMRLDQELSERLDRWRSDQFDLPSRSEAARRLIESAISEKTSPRMRFSHGEQLTLYMLCDLFKHLKIRGDVDPSFLSSALSGGHYWSLMWEYSMMLHDQGADEQKVKEVVNVLDMWTFIEGGFGRLSKKEKDNIKADADVFNETFIGFDGNNESEHYSIARFMIDDLGRFSNFKGRDLNSHSPSMGGYRNMLALFERIRPTLVGVGLNASQILELLKARHLST